MLVKVKENGDGALRKYTLKFDKASISEIEVSRGDIDSARQSVDRIFISHLKKAASNIQAFHKAQVLKDWVKGVCSRKQTGSAHYTP